ncbi:hypothetical protein Aperf_G00000123218 [Anoplocephala perfoliata]
MLDRPDGEMDIAFTMVIHKDILQVARLLRMIHRINNYYCIHLDARSTRTLREAVEGMARCFGANVELVPLEKRIAVVWGDESVLRPQLICGEQALERHQTWKYLINIVGQERTNLELIAALKALNGSNLVKAFPIDRIRDWVKNDVLPLQPFHDQSTIPEPNEPSRGLNPQLLADGHLSLSGYFTCEFRHTSTMLPVSRYTPIRPDHTQLL